MSSLLVVAAAAALLGLRHAADPDHLAAVSAMAVGDRRGAARLGLLWGIGHASSLLAFGVPVVLWRAALPDAVERGVEASIGCVIVALAVSLLRRRRVRTPRRALLVGVLHGIGGSGAVGVLLLAAIADTRTALGALVVFAACTALSMTVLSAGVGRAAGVLATPRLVPVLGAAGIAFGAWYAAAALVL